MPATSVHDHPRGYRIVFEEETHAYYTILTGKASNAVSAPPQVRVDYTSGTTFVHRFCPPFDPDGRIAERKAREAGVSPEQIRFAWRQKGAEACAMGTRVHETCEDILRGRPFRNAPADAHERKLMAAGWDACRRIASEYDILGIEQMVGDVDCEIAGTIDLLVRHRKTGAVGIFDWKTNEKVEFTNNFRTGSRLKEPVAHLHNCSGVLYALQLNLYQYLLVKAGYLPRDTRFERTIIHLTEGGPVFHALPDLQVEVRDMVIFALEQPIF